MRDTNRKPEVVYLVGKRVIGALKGKIQDYQGTFETKRKALDACTDPTLTFYDVENTPEAINKHVPDLSKKVKGKGGTTVLTSHEDSQEG